MSAQARSGPVRGSRTGRPIMALLDLLGRRHSLRLLWELREGPLTFRALQAACGDVSPSVLNTRLRELRDAGLVERDEEGYAATACAREIEPMLLDLDRWARERWAARR